MVPEQRHARRALHIDHGVRRERDSVGLRLVDAVVERLALDADKEVRREPHARRISCAADGGKPERAARLIRERRRIVRRLQPLREEHRAARRRVGKRRRERGRDAGAPRSEDDAARLLRNLDRLAQRMTLIVLLLLREQPFDIVAREHTRDILWIVEDEIAVPRDCVRLRPGLLLRPFDGCEIAQCPEMQEAVHAQILEETAEQQHREENQIHASFIHAQASYPSNESLRARQRRDGRAAS